MPTSAVEEARSTKTPGPPGLAGAGVRGPDIKPGGRTVRAMSGDRALPGDRLVDGGHVARVSSLVVVCLSHRHAVARVTIRSTSASEGLRAISPIFSKPWVHQ